MAKGNTKKSAQDQELLDMFEQALAKDCSITADSIWNIWHSGDTNISRAFVVRKLASGFRKLAKRGIIKKSTSFRLSQRTSRPLPVWIRCK